VTLLERKFAARMQSRIGPYRVGPHGLLQPIADALKLMMKEDIVPRAADRWVYNLAPIVFLLPCVLIFATLPFAPSVGLADLNIGVLFFLAVSSLEIVGLFMGGWGSNNKYALLSAMRAVNQIISYDLPFVFTALIPVLLAGSLQMSAIVAAQQGLWFVAYPIIGQLGFIAFLVATIAAENRVPFDILEAESELVAGFRVEYSGMKFALIQLGEYAHMMASSFLGALLFLGGWLGPGSDYWAIGALWFVLKAMLVFLVVTWVRWSFVRIRVDQILAISWKLLLPASLILLLVTAFWVAARGGAGA
jgi:NADH-quinone oxidoreductase subunit H